MSILYENVIFDVMFKCMGNIFCVEYKTTRNILPLHYAYYIRRWNFEMSYIQQLLSICKTPYGTQQQFQNINKAASICISGHNSHKPKQPKPKQPQTETATERKDHRTKWPQMEMATDRNGHKPKRPQTDGHKLSNIYYVKSSKNERKCKSCWFFASFVFIFANWINCF